MIPKGKALVICVVIVVTALVLSYFILPLVHKSSREERVEVYSSQKTPRKTTIVDSANRTIELELPIRSIAALAGDTLRVLAILNSLDVVTGISTYWFDQKYYYSEFLVYWNLSGRVRDIGSFFRPSYEAIIELKPQVVIQYAPYAPELDEKLAEANITVLRLYLYRPHIMVNEVKLLASILGREKEAEEYEKFVKEVMSIASDRLKNLREDKKLRVYPAIMSRLTQAAAPGSGLYEAVLLAELSPVTSGFGAPYPTVSIEWIIEVDPDVVVWTASPISRLRVEVYENYYRAVVANLSLTNAGREGRVIIMPYEVMYGLGYPVGVLYVAKIAYPELFADVDPNVYLCRYLQMQHLPCRGVWGYAGPGRLVLGWLTSE